MTVAYMKTTKHRLPVTSSSSSGPVAPPPGCDDQLRTYLSGFQECAIQVCSFLMDESPGGVGGGGGGIGVGGADLRGQLTQHLSGCFHRMELDFKTRKERQATSASFCSNSTDESAKDKKKIQCEDRLCQLLLSSSSSSDNNDVRRATSSALSPLVASAAAAASSNYKAEMPRIVGVCSAGNPSHFPPTLHSLFQESHRNPVGAAEQASHPTTRKSNSVVSQTQRIVSSVPLNKSSSLPIQHQHQHCRSPQKGDDFPLSFAASRSSPMFNAVEPTRYALNPLYRFHHESIHGVDCNASAIWRPW